MTKRTLIISAFPACGKTYLYRYQDGLLFTDYTDYSRKKICCSFVDSDSSKFGKYDGWEKEYIDHIESLIGTVDFIFISQHDDVLRELSNRNIPFVKVYPNNTSEITNTERMLIKQQWFGRFALRDNSHIKDLNSWMMKLSQNYDKWTSDESINKYDPVEVFLLKQDEYLSDIIPELYYKKEKHSKYIKK